MKVLTPPPSPQGVPPALLAELRAIIEELLRPALEALSAPPGKLLTSEDAAQWLNVSLRTLDTLCAAGDLVPVYIRGVRRFAPDSLRSYVRAQMRAPRAQRLRFAPAA